MQGDDLIDLVADAKNRIQCGHRLLKDHGDKVAAQMLHNNIRRFGNVVGLIAEIQADLAFDNLPLRALEKLHDRKARHRFPAAGFPHHADRFADGDVERNAVYGMYRTDVGKKVGMQILNLQHVAGVLHCSQVLAFGNILAFMLFFQSIGDPAVFFRNAAGFFRG